MDRTRTTRHPCRLHALLSGQDDQMCLHCGDGSGTAQGGLMDQTADAVLGTGVQQPA